jgi:hypothetical protein
MTGLDLGEKVKVSYADDRTYTLDVEVTAIRPPNEFIGRVEAIFLPSVGELTSGQAFDELMGQEKTFKNEDIVRRRADLP